MRRSLCAVLNLHTKVVVVIDDTLTETWARVVVSTDAGRLYAEHDIATPLDTPERALRINAGIGASPGETKGEMIRDAVHGDGDALEEITGRMGMVWPTAPDSTVGVCNALKGNDGAMPIDIPRDRDGSFEPEPVRKGQTRIDGMDDKITGLYAAGLSTCDISSDLEEVYGLRVSADLISCVTDAVPEEVSDWQNRALERFTRSFSLMPCVLKSAMPRAVRSRTRPYTWPWASPLMASVRFRACGLPPMKGPNSGCPL